MAQKTSVTVQCAGVTIFVGPNRSGKSLALRELIRHFIPQDNRWSPLLVASIGLADFDPLVLFERLCSQFPVISRSESGGAAREHILFTSFHDPSGSGSLPLEEVKRRLHAKDERLFRSPLLAHLYVYLSGRTRFNVLAKQELGSLRAGARNMLATLYHSPGTVETVNRFLKESFGYEMFIDFSETPVLQVRFSRSGVPSEVQLLKSATRPVAEWCHKNKPR